jgi:hypothetical protein
MNTKESKLRFAVVGISNILKLLKIVSHILPKIPARSDVGIWIISSSETVNRFAKFKKI